MSRPIGVKVATLLFVILTANGLWQGVGGLLGPSREPFPLPLLQLASGISALVTAIGAWRRARWSSLASVAYGAITGAMLAALPYILGLAADERMGLWSSAAIVLLFGVAAGWYLHRQHEAPLA